MVIQRESGCIQREAGTADNFFGEHFYGTFRSNKEHFFSIFQWIGSDHLRYKVTLVQIESRGENDLLGALEALTLEIKSETDSNNFTDCFGRGGGKRRRKAIIIVFTWVRSIIIIIVV